MRRNFSFILAVTLLTLALVAIGCNGKASSRVSSREVIRHPATGAIVYQRDVGNSATQELPANASGPTTQAVTVDGVTSSLAGTHEKPLGAYGVESRNRLLYGSGVGLLAMAAIAAWRRLWMLAASAAAAASVVFAVAMLAAEPMLAALAALPVLGGLIWLAARKFAEARENAAGVTSTLKLGLEGKAFEAIAALRETPLARRVGV